MKETLVLSVFLLTTALYTAYGGPYVFFPDIMLPPTGGTVMFSYEGYMSNISMHGVFAVEKNVLSDNTVGYRTWQSYDGDYKTLVYGVTYQNGTYVQAELDPNTTTCHEAFVQTFNCTGWIKTAMSQYMNRCVYYRHDLGITAELSATVRSTEIDPQRPLNMLLSSTIPGSSETTTVLYNFLSKNFDKFPSVQCYF